MIPLTIVACLIASPVHCIVDTVPVDWRTCILGGANTHVEDWLAKHPAFFVQRYRCGDAGKEARA